MGCGVRGGDDGCCCCCYRCRRYGASASVRAAQHCPGVDGILRVHVLEAGQRAGSDDGSGQQQHGHGGKVSSAAGQALARLGGPQRRPRSRPALPGAGEAARGPGCLELSASATSLTSPGWMARR